MRLTALMLIASLLTDQAAIAAGNCHTEVMGDDYGHEYSIQACCDVYGNNCHVTTAPRLDKIYDRCHYETRSDQYGSYNVLVCCDEYGKCRERRVR